MEYLINKCISFHLHTKFSHDSLLNPNSIVDTAVKNNIDLIIITDHDTIKGAEHAKKYAENRYPGKIDVIIGEEIKTDIGDIIGFPLKEKINSFHYHDVFSEIKEQGGYICLPHPYQGHDLFLIHEPGFILNFDFIEIFNSRLSQKENEAAKKLQEKYKIKPIVGADAHLKTELFNAYFTYEKDYEVKNWKLVETTNRNKRMVSAIKYAKKGNFSRLFKYLVLFIFNI